jgi:hypothetical protein
VLDALRAFGGDTGALAAAAGVSRRTVQRWARGARGLGGEVRGLKRPAALAGPLRRAAIHDLAAALRRRGGTVQFSGEIRISETVYATAFELDLRGSDLEDTANALDTAADSDGDLGAPAVVAALSGDLIAGWDHKGTVTAVASLGEVDELGVTPR